MGSEDDCQMLFASLQLLTRESGVSESCWRCLRSLGFRIEIFNWAHVFSNQDLLYFHHLGIVRHPSGRWAFKGQSAASKLKPRNCITLHRGAPITEQRCWTIGVYGKGLQGVMSHLECTACVNLYSVVPTTVHITDCGKIHCVFVRSSHSTHTFTKWLGCTLQIRVRFKNSAFSSIFLIVLISFMHIGIRNHLDTVLDTTGFLTSVKFHDITSDSNHLCQNKFTSQVLTDSSNLI